MSRSGSSAGHPAHLHYHQLQPAYHAATGQRYHDQAGQQWSSSRQSPRQMSYEDLTLAPLHTQRYATSQRHSKPSPPMLVQTRPAIATKRISIADLVRPAAASKQRALDTPERTVSGSSDVLPPPDRWPVHYQPTQQFTAVNRPWNHSNPRITSVRQHQPGGTLDYTQWTKPEPDTRPSPRPSSNGEGPSKPHGNESTSSVPSPASSYGQSLNTLSPLIRPSTPSTLVRATQPLDYDFALSFRQQPVAARACGLGDRDRRTVDPPPILELKITSKTDGFPVQDHSVMLVLHCELRDVNGGPPVNLPQSGDDSRPVTAMMGNYVASPFPGKDDRGMAGTFFVLSDLSCRYPGKYKLHFTLLRLDCQAMHTGRIATTALSETFTAYSAKDFPGMRESTPLLKQLRRQGLSVGIKKGSEARKQKGKQKKTSPSLDQDDSEHEVVNTQRFGRARDSPMSEQGSPAALAGRSKKRRREA